MWFGEAVPAMDEAVQIAAKADIFLVIGTSLNVYPAASLVNFAPRRCPIIVIDPYRPPVHQDHVIFIEEKASLGMQKFIDLLQSNQL